MANVSHTRNMERCRSFSTRCFLFGTVIIAAAIVILGLVVYFAFGSKPKDRGNDTVRERYTQSSRSQLRHCRTADCLQVSWLYTVSLDTTKNPCDDFYQFVCSGVPERHQTKNDSTVGQMAANLTSAFRQRLSVARTPDKGQTAFEKAAAFYRSCLQNENNSSSNRALLLNFLRDRSLSFTKGDNFFPIRTLVRLMFVDNIHFLFQIDISRRVISKGRHVFQLLPSVEFDAWIGKRKALLDDAERYELVVASVLTVIGVSKEREQMELINNIRALETKLINFKSGLKKPGTELTFPLSHLGVWAAGSSLQQDEWSKYLSIYTNDKLPRHYSVSGDNGTFSFLGYLVRNFTNEQLRCFMTWEVARLLSDISGLVKLDDDHRHELQCYKHTRDLFRHAVTSPYLFEIVNTSRLYRINVMVHHLTAKFEQAILKSNWLKGDALKFTLRKLHRISSRIGFPTGLDSRSGVEEFYSVYPDVKGTFLSGYLSSTMGAIRRKLHLATQTREPNPRNFDFETNKVNAYYHEFGEYTLLPAGVLTSPIYGYGAPPEVNYGGLGRIMAHEVMHAIDRSWLSTGRTRGRSLISTTEVYETYMSKLNCLLKSTSSAIERSGVPGKWNGEHLADHMGQASLIDAYKEASRNVEFTLPGLSNFTSDQLFFISSCFFLCSSYNRGRGGSHPPRPDRCNVPLKHSELFARAFKCLPGAKMNPVNRCTFW